MAYNPNAFPHNDNQRRGSSSGSGLLIVLLLAVIAFQSYYIWTGHWPSWAASTMSKLSTTAHKDTMEIHDSAVSTLNPSTPVDTSSNKTVASNNEQTLSDNMQRLKEKVTQSVHSVQNFANSKGLSVPPATDPNLREETDRYTLSVDIPNADKSTINVNVDGRILTISGTNQKSASQNQSGVVTSDTQSNSFLRSVLLPPLADSTKVQAKYDQSTLTVTIPKLEQPSSGTQVQVQ